ncbi:glutamate racemase [Clostridium botulinum C]|uniref:Glutamate racemase n=3 Tax=Clostridium botulinum TaxID=1491 RepID=A0A9Q4TI96_CLOBO|nr:MULTISPECIES: glutamate racemase [Clostridium]EGO88681.1 glutamate racemase [Clostridium botulinum C str. Stockholm]AYF54076.1 glutamate racemase [Clostridium novyi]EES92429.1 glutamate racemase [Clostridium botulinum D str. 1873]MBO3440951.1 glutamate racemase [Clostridium haemolyticum]MCD3195443.1 glutamate racemase [Clostridium botulinum C]
MDITRMPIGFFDSGVGGLSVLKEAIKILPNEDFIYYGDSKNAPYGTKKVDEVKKLTFDAVKVLLGYNVKAIVVACNTATSAAIEDLRNTYKDMPIIGIEPALKPAVELSGDGKIVIMATNMTLAEKKFNKLMSKYKDKCDIVSLPCPGLVEYIEKGIVEGKKLKEFLVEKLSILDKDKIASVVLGCTHYPFIKKELYSILGDEVVIIDGSFGTANQLKRKLIKSNSINKENKKGKITILNSLKDDEIIKISKKLLCI